MTAAAPAWMVEIQRPKPYVRPAMPVGGSADLGDGHAYAIKSVVGALAEIEALTPGGRNGGAFSRACRLHELAIAPWARLDFEQVQTAFLEACASIDTDPADPFTYGEAWSIWLKAGRHVKEPASLPAATHLGEFIPWSDIPGGEATFAHAVQGAADGGDESAPALSGFELQVLAEMAKLAVRDEARRRMAELARVQVDFGAEVLDDDGLAELGEAVPLIAGYLDLDTLARMNGPSGHGKSFVALDMAACVAQGRVWHGKRVTQAGVLYVAAEGARGLRKRVAAWCEHARVASSGVRFLPRALVVNGPEWPSFVDYAAGLKPGLIVLDTQARMTVGVDENSNTEMSVIMNALDELRRATGACVLLVHHRGLMGTHGRGATSVRGALDSEMDVTKAGMTVTVTSHKVKDDALAAPLLLTLNPIGASLVLVGATDPDALGIMDPVTTRDIGRERALQLVEVLRREFGQGNGGTRAEIRALFFAVEGIGSLGAKGKNSAWQRAWGRLEEAGRIARNPIAERFRFVDIPDLDDLADNPRSLSEFGWPTAEKPTKRTR